MRTVPLKVNLRLRAPAFCTNPGRSSVPRRLSQSTGYPSSPAIDVKVPHSWTVKPSSFDALRSAAMSQVAAEKTRTPAPIWVFNPRCMLYDLHTAALDALGFD